jgi:septal ring factor EnvC (AmiA/AmiB activator)
LLVKNLAKAKRVFHAVDVNLAASSPKTGRLRRRLGKHNNFYDMKTFLLVLFVVVSVVLGYVLYSTNQSDTAQHNKDTASIYDLSNDLSTVQAQVAANSDTINTLSNNLVASQSTSLTLSNQLADSQSALSRSQDQVAGLNTKVSEMEATNEAVNQRATQLAGSVATLTQQLSTTQTNLATTSKTLDQANKDYYLLENRFRINVAERVVLQRRFYNPQELKAQLESLKIDPSQEVTAEMIYAGLDVQVRSNGTFHVIEPN